MKRVIFIIVMFICMLVGKKVYSQDQITGIVKGRVTEKFTAEPMPHVNVVAHGTGYGGCVTDENGEFTLGPLPIGRYSITASYIGFETVILSEVEVKSSKTGNIAISLNEVSGSLNEVTVMPELVKNKPLNNMALSGGRMLSVEEASRYAGGMDDPARLVGSFAGVSAGVGNNGISVHGNAPSFLLWRLEDIEITAPNHFADLTTLGGGLLSSLSNNVLGNSDFFTGAFPAEYSNGLSGVFDMKLRNGNSDKYSHTLQIGVLGIDVASEGPLSHNSNASYLFNYRYSTTGLMSRIGAVEQTFEYQDINFKINVPIKSVGTFSLWGTGLADKIPAEVEDPSEWEYSDDAKASRLTQMSAAGGLTYSYYAHRLGSLKATLAVTYNKQDAKEDMNIIGGDENSLTIVPNTDFENEFKNYVFNISHYKRYDKSFAAKAGATYTAMDYNMNMSLAPYTDAPLDIISQGAGNTSLFSAYISTLINVSDRVSASIGMAGQYLFLNKNYSLEPRASLKIKTSSRGYISVAYGIHSRMEKTDIYFVKNMDGELVNENLGFIKSHHASMTFGYRISENTILKIEPYTQYLYDVPVISDSSYCILNRATPYVQDKLVNDGEGLNYGVDLTLEKYMTRGFYYMITATLFDSKYKGGDGKWYNTRYNRKYIVNALAGKELYFGKKGNRMIGLNVKVTCQGGDRYSPVNEEATYADPYKKCIYDETKAYSEQFAPVWLVNYTLSYRVSGKNLTREFAVKALNATGYKEYFGHEYNIKTNVIEPRRLKNSMINVIYRLEF